MARPAKIWWRQGRGWYATIAGKKVLLHKTSKEEAEREFHHLKSKENAPLLQEYNPLAVVFECYLDYLSGRGSYRAGKFYLQSFKDRHPNVRVADLRALHVEQWLHGHPTWHDTTRNHAISVLLACLNWAAKPQNRLIPSNPLRGMSKPPARSRGKEVLVQQEDLDAVLSIANQEFKEFVFALQQTAARPSTVCELTAEHCDFANDLIVLAKHKTYRRTGRDLVIPMTAPLKELLVKLCERHPTGKLFRTHRGLAWTSQYVAEYLIAMKNKLREKGIVLKGRLVPYSFRHSTATSLLEQGVPLDRVAAILGHSNLSTCQKHYAHVSAKTLRSDLEKINAGGAASSGEQAQS